MTFALTIAAVWRLDKLDRVGELRMFGQPILEIGQPLMTSPNGGFEAFDPDACDRETGMNFSRWRRQLQIVIALRRLASDLGYETAGAFISMFKAVMGKPPARYIAERCGRRETPS